MADDVRALIDHLGLPRADVMGYSMGARNTVFLAMANPQRARSAVLGGIGIRLVDRAGLPETIAEALEAPSLADVSDPFGHMFRAFAEQTRSDLRALAACLRGSRQPLTRAELARIAVPVLVAAGSERSDRRLAARARRAGAGRQGACHSRARSHGGGRRSGFQSRRAAVPGAAALSPRRTGLWPSRSASGPPVWRLGACLRSSLGFRACGPQYDRKRRPCRALFRETVPMSATSGSFGPRYGRSGLEARPL